MLERGIPTSLLYVGVGRRQLDEGDVSQALLSVVGDAYGANLGRVVVLDPFMVLCEPFCCVEGRALAEWHGLEDRGSRTGRPSQSGEGKGRSRRPSDRDGSEWEPGGCAQSGARQRVGQHGCQKDLGCSRNRSEAAQRRKRVSGREAHPIVWLPRGQDKTQLLRA